VYCLIVLLDAAVVFRRDRVAAATMVSRAGSEENTSFDDDGGCFSRHKDLFY
jgi:hypothetical protein